MSTTEPTDSAALAGVEVLLGVTGGIAAYKSADLASKLVQRGAGVSVVLSGGAQRFIGATTFEALTGRPVHSELFEPRANFQGEHIGLGRPADLFVVAPATANFLGKAAHGLADDLLSTVALVVTCPLVAAPAMNSEMWSKPPVQRNIAQLQEDGWHIVAPGEGWLSCRQVGPGRMAEPAEMLPLLQELAPSQ